MYVSSTVECIALLKGCMYPIMKGCIYACLCFLVCLGVFGCVRACVHMYVCVCVFANIT